MKDDVIRVFKELDADDNVRAVVMTGGPNKGKAFCAGVSSALHPYKHAVQ